MHLYLGADHRGFNLKESLKDFLKEIHIDFTDEGTLYPNSEDDFNDFAKQVVKSVLENSDSFGVLICGSGQGMCIQANRFRGIRAALCHSAEEAAETRSHNNANILCLAADSENDHKAIIKKFIETEPLFDEKYQRRINKMDEI